MRRCDEIEIGDELGDYEPDVSMECVRRFARAGKMEFGRFTDHEAARKEGLPGAIVPGVMSQGILAAAVHRWAPGSHIERIDTIFRSPIPVDARVTCRATVTDVDVARRTVEIDLTIATDDAETRVLGTATVRFD